VPSSPDASRHEVVPGRRQELLLHQIADLHGRHDVGGRAVQLQ